MVKLGSDSILPRHSRQAFPSMSPMIATRRPPLSMEDRALSMCFTPWAESRFPCTLPEVLEKGGFITTTVGVAPAFFMWALMNRASSVRSAFQPGMASSSFARRSRSNSLTMTSAPDSRGNTAMPPTPAEGSRTRSPGRTLATQATTAE
jgi:hypothetical protein